jgi:phage terminase small subunit
LLTKSNVQRLIAELSKKQADNLGLTAEKVLRELMLMGFSNMQDYVSIQKDGFAYVDLSKLTREQAAAIQEITTDSYVADSEDDKGEEQGRIVTKVKFKLADKRGSLELLGKHLKLFVEQTEVSGPGGGPVPIQIVNHIPRPKRASKPATV